MKINREKKFTKLEKAVLSTICYYDVFDYPLTHEEIWRWLYVKDGDLDFGKDLNQIIETLETSPRLQKVISSDENYYFLRGRREIVEMRKERFIVDQKKWDIARYVVSYLRMAPFLKYVAVCNNLAINNAKKESDIDFFIVIESDYLWLGRAFITALVHILGRRRYKDKIKDRICLSFFVAEDSLNFQELLLPNGDPYFTFWIDQLVPLYDEGNYHQKIKEANPWVKEKLPNAFSKNEHKLISQNFFTSFLKKFFTALFLNPIFGRNLQDFIHRRQIMKIQRNKESHWLENNTKVVINDKILKFHEEDRREEYRERFYKKLKEVGIK